jgi:hypothetical protein
MYIPNKDISRKKTEYKYSYLFCFDWFYQIGNSSSVFIYRGVGKQIQFSKKYCR